MTATLDAALFTSFLNTSLEVQRPTLRSDGAGGSSEEMVVVATVAGRVRPLTPREMASAARLDVQFDHIAYLEASADVARGDYLRHATAGTRWRVVAVGDPSLAAHHLEARCVRVEDA